MPRNDDHSEGDARQPYSDEGGPEGHHAQTHDVRREQATRSKPHDDGPDEFAADLRADPSTGGHVDESISASDDKDLKGTMPGLDQADLKQLSILTVGTRLDQGSTYVDLNHLEQGPFTAIGGQEAGADDRYIAKRDTDNELWDRLVGHGRTVRTERPGDQG